MGGRPLIGQAALDLMARHRAIAGVKVRGARLDPLDDGLADLHRGLPEFALHAVGAVVTGASLDGQHGGLRHQLQNVARLETDVLHAQVTGDVVGDLSQRARTGSGDPGDAPRASTPEGSSPREITAHAESTAELLCAELAADGLPIDLATAGELLAGIIGPRPRDEREAAAIRAGRDRPTISCHHAIPLQQRGSADNDHGG